jgi:hypothetical protein
MERMLQGWRQGWTFDQASHLQGLRESWTFDQASLHPPEATNIFSAQTIQALTTKNMLVASDGWIEILEGMLKN